MRGFVHSFVVATALCVSIGSESAFGAPSCTYNSTLKTGTGCPENFKCSPRGVCEEAFTMAEIAEAVKAPPAPYPNPPATREDCEKTKGWGIVGDSCLPTCQTYQELWKKQTSQANRPEVGYSGCTSYVEMKPEDRCPKQDPLRLFSQYSIPAFGTPKGFVCCVKVCSGDPAPYNYQTHILPLFGGKDDSEKSGPQLGAPLYPDGRPLPSDTLPRPFTGPAPKKRR